MRSSLAFPSVLLVGCGVIAAGAWWVLAGFGLVVLSATESGSSPIGVALIVLAAVIAGGSLGGGLFWHVASAFQVRPVARTMIGWVLAQPVLPAGLVAGLYADDVLDAAALVLVGPAVTTAVATAGIARVLSRPGDAV